MKTQSTIATLGMKVYHTESNSRPYSKLRRRIRKEHEARKRHRLDD